MSSIFVNIGVLVLVLANVNCLVQVENSQLQQHFYSNGQSSGMGSLGAIIVGIIAGVLCFLGIIYFFKWRR